MLLFFFVPVNIVAARLYESLSGGTIKPKKYRIPRFGKNLQKSFRLMVGVPDYENYVQHMKHHHPDLTPMDAKTFYRHCVDARYPSSGNMKKCPC